jgi:hypothetical protein
MSNKGKKRYLAVKGYYGSQYGWEVVTAAENYKEARQLLKDYNENESQYAHKIGFAYE